MTSRLERQTTIQFTARLPAELHTWLSERAALNHRSANAELAVVLRDADKEQAPGRALPMETAPRDGTRILIKNHQLGYEERGGWKHTGTAWEECWWAWGKWQVWCGSTKTVQTGGVDPICWAPLPSE